MTELVILSVPYNVPGVTSSGRVIVSAGHVTIPDDVSRVKLLVDHDRSEVIGHATDSEETPAGLLVRFTVPSSLTADAALESYRAGLRDAASPGVDWDDATLLRLKRHGATAAIRAAGVLREVSLVAVGGFVDARVIEEIS